METWNGFKITKTQFCGKELISVFPHKPNGKWLLKTEYFDAFPDVEIRLVEMGYHLFHLQNETRWHVWEDTERRAKLAEYVHETYGLSKKCVVVGMSCGGMQGIYFGATHPECVSCMYIDAPVVNLLSCPGDMGKSHGGMLQEFLNDKNMSVEDLMVYRDHPYDHINKLTDTKIPVILVAGDSDTVVPYDENGIYVEKAYKAADNIIEVIIKPGCDHHPHSLEDITPIIDFITKYDV